jgi:hypothetical protein
MNSRLKNLAEARGWQEGGGQRGQPEDDDRRTTVGGRWPGGSGQRAAASGWRPKQNAARGTDHGRSADGAGTGRGRVRPGASEADGRGRTENRPWAVSGRGRDGDRMWPEVADRSKQQAKDDGDGGRNEAGGDRRKRKFWIKARVAVCGGCPRPGL